MTVESSENFKIPYTKEYGQLSFFVHFGHKIDSS